MTSKPCDKPVFRVSRQMSLRHCDKGLSGEAVLPLKTPRHGCDMAATWPAIATATGVIYNPVAMSQGKREVGNCPADASPGGLHPLPPASKQFSKPTMQLWQMDR